MSWQIWAALGGAIAASSAPARCGARVDRLAEDGRLDTPPPGVVGGPRRARWPLLGRLGLAALVGAVWAIGGALLAVAAGAIGAAVGVLVRDAARRRERTRSDAELRAAVRVLIGELEAGARPPAALSAAGQAAPRFAATFAAGAAAATGGEDAGPVLMSAAATRPIGLAWQLSAETGLELAGVLDRVAADLRAQQHQRHTVDVALSGPRASAALLSGLPLVGIALGSAMGARPLTVLTASGPGRALACAGVLLDVAGLLWMRRILANAERM